MPELPEVETVRRYLAPRLTGRRIVRAKVLRRDLRAPVEASLARRLRDQEILDVGRRAKYLLIKTGGGALVFHFGMSGTLRLYPPPPPPLAKHDHFQAEISGGDMLRYNDPRRFGLIVFRAGGAATDKPLGPEPLSRGFDGERLHRAARGRKAAIKTLLMNPAAVAGVGNIYAGEALHRAGILPSRLAGSLSAQECAKLAAEIKAVLREAIKRGGSSARDFVGGGGEPGYFQARWRTYDRAGLPCKKCGGKIVRAVL